MFVFDRANGGKRFLFGKPALENVRKEDFLKIFFIPRIFQKHSFLFYIALSMFT